MFLNCCLFCDHTETSSHCFFPLTPVLLLFWRLSLLLVFTEQVFVWGSKVRWRQLDYWHGNVVSQVGLWFRSIQDLWGFQSVWDHEQVLFSVLENVLVFSEQRAEPHWVYWQILTQSLMFWSSISSLSLCLLMSLRDLTVDQFSWCLTDSLTVCCSVGHWPQVSQ